MPPRTARPWLLCSIAAAALAVAGSLTALVGQQVYERLTVAVLAQALAQDLVNLLLVSPAVMLLALLALRGSLRAYPLWLGTLLFTAYNYVIYTVAVPFGSLFLLWVAVLGLTLFALLGGAAGVDRGELLVRYADARVPRTASWALVVIAVLFGALWLSEDVSALLAGTTPASLVEQGMITNPVHILDLAFFLPAALLVAGGCLRGSKRAATLVPAFLVFLLLTGVPILGTLLVQAARGWTPGWAVVIPVGIVTLVVLVLLGRLIPSMTVEAATDG